MHEKGSGYSALSGGKDLPYLAAEERKGPGGCGDQGKRRGSFFPS